MGPYMDAWCLKVSSCSDFIINRQVSIKPVTRLQTLPEKTFIILLWHLFKERGDYAGALTAILQCVCKSLHGSLALMS